jgi:glutathione S-transferase
VSDDLVFYTNPMSRGRIVRWMLEEVGEPYRTTYLTFDGTMKDRDYTRINPMGKVPAIDHRGVVVTECAAICAYLADAFPDRGLAPAPDRRADYYRWMFFVAGPLEAATSNKALGFAVPRERERMVGYGSLDAVIDTLEAAVSRAPYIAGDTFTAADVYVGAQLGWGMMMGSIDRRPAFADYLDRLGERPAFRRAREMDDAAAREFGMTG